jgi:hypothetical protein
VPKAVDPTIPPVHVDGFDDLRPIGRGGFSYVFSARQRDFNRRVALKVLAFGLVDERERRSFERECRAMGLVSQHPHIVTVVNAAFSDTKQPCIVMELYSGGTLGERVKQDGPLPVAQVLEVGVKICGALQTAHDRGLLHRDIKPHNLFISEFGEPALGDFGISTLDDERSISGGGGLTVHYAPPEVLEGAAATPRSDVYSLAATLYTLLEGTRPFAPADGSRQTVGDLARRIMLESPPRAERVPRPLGEVLARAMSKLPADRPESAAAFGEELRRIQAELGLTPTVLPVATTPAPPADPLPAPTATPVSSAAPAPAPVSADDDDGHTVTVARAPAPAVQPATEPEPGGPGTRRILIGTAAGIIGLLAIALTVFLLGRGGDDDTPAASTTPASTQVVPLRLPAPQDVTVSAVADQAQVVVRWTAVGAPGTGITYQVEPQNGELLPQRTELLEVTYDDVPPELEPCFRVVAISSAGQIGAESDLACL